MEEQKKDEVVVTEAEDIRSDLTSDDLEDVSGGCSNGGCTSID